MLYLKTKIKTLPTQPGLSVIFNLVLFRSGSICYLSLGCYFLLKGSLYRFDGAILMSVLQLQSFEVIIKDLAN